MLYVKQVDPEWQDSYLFYCNKKNELYFNDDYYTDNVILDGNRHFCGITTHAYELLQRNFDDVMYIYENLPCYNFTNLTDLISWYLPRDKKYSTREIHAWKLLLDKATYLEDICEDALFLLTGKRWTAITIRGCCQGDWQTGYVSEDINDKALAYLEACYFNTGTEYLVYESKEDFDNNEDAYSIYVVDSIEEELGTDDYELYEFKGYRKEAIYERVSR